MRADYCAAAILQGVRAVRDCREGRRSVRVVQDRAKSTESTGRLGWPAERSQPQTSPTRLVAQEPAISTAATSRQSPLLSPGPNYVNAGALLQINECRHSATSFLCISPLSMPRRSLSRYGPRRGYSRYTRRPQAHCLRCSDRSCNSRRRRSERR